MVYFILLKKWFISKREILKGYLDTSNNTITLKYTKTDKKVKRGINIISVELEFKVKVSINFVWN